MLALHFFFIFEPFLTTPNSQPFLQLLTFADAGWLMKQLSQSFQRYKPVSPTTNFGNEEVFAETQNIKN